MKLDGRYIITVESRGSDFERIEDIGADALRAARRALDWTDELASEPFLALHREIAGLRQTVERRGALTRDGRVAMRNLYDAVVGLVACPPEGAASNLLRELHESLGAAERVADLLAAERHVGRCRGISC